MKIVKVERLEDRAIVAGGDVCSVGRREAGAGLLSGGDGPPAYHARQGRE